MAIRYRVDVLQALRDKGYSSYKLRADKLFGQRTIQQLRDGEIVSLANLDTLCRLLECQPGDLLEYVPDDPLD